MKNLNKYITKHMSSFELRFVQLVANLETKISQADEIGNVLPDLRVYIHEEYKVKEFIKEMKKVYNENLKKSKEEYNDADFYEFSIAMALEKDTINTIKYMLTYRYNNDVNLSLARDKNYSEVLNLKEGKVTIVFISKPNKEKLKKIVEEANNNKELRKKFYFDEITADEKLSGRNVEREVYKLIEKYGKEKHIVLFAKGLASRSFSMPPLVNVIIGIKEPSHSSLIQKIFRGMTPDKNNKDKTCNVLMLNFNTEIAIKVAYENFYKDLENQTEVIKEIRKANEKVTGETQNFERNSEQNFDEYISYFKPKIINLSDGSVFVEAEDFYKYIYEPHEIQKQIIWRDTKSMNKHLYDEGFFNGLKNFESYFTATKGKGFAFQTEVNTKHTSLKPKKQKKGESEKNRKEKNKNKKLIQNFNEYIHYTFDDVLETYTLDEIKSNNKYFMSSFLDVLVSLNEQIGKTTPQCAFETEHKEFYDFIDKYYEDCMKEYLLKSYNTRIKVK